MPPGVEKGHTNLMQIFICDYKDLSNMFKQYDITYEKLDDAGEYELPKTKLMVLILETYVLETHTNSLWTTIRRWTPEKERYYQSLVGQQVGIIIKHE